MSLTGNKPYRIEKPLFGKPRLVLQVEYKVGHVKDLNGSGYYDEWTTTHWRDARLEDVTTQVVS